MADRIEDLGEYLDKVVNRIDGAVARVQIVSLNELLGLYKQRIFNKGKDSDNGKIGKYSTKTTLVGASSFTKKSTIKKVFGTKRGQRWRTVKVKGKNQPLLLLSGGYKRIRQLDGFQTSTVDLQRTGDLFNSIIVGTSGQNKVIGLTDKGSGKNRAKIEGNERRFKKDIFDITDKEEQALINRVMREVDRILAQ